MNVELLTAPYFPYQWIAPPYFALLLLNVELLMVPFLPFHRIAPPSLSLSLAPFAFALVNVMLLMITLSAEIWKIRAVFEPSMVSKCYVVDDYIIC